MKISALFDGISEKDGEREINGLCCDSRNAEKNDIFFCVCGEKDDGHAHALAAYEKGCRVFVCEKELILPDNALKIKTDCVRRTMAEAASKFYGNPCRSLFTIALTGTKGKTSTAFMIKKILESSGRKVGVIGTLGIVYGNENIKCVNTTPESILIHKYCRLMAESGIDTVIFEVSSQSLKQYRTHGITFDVGIFTNLSPDHIGQGEHADYEEYRECKKKLFYSCSVGFFNCDDAEYGYMTDGVPCDIHTFGMRDGAEYKAENAAFPLKNGVMTSEYVVDGTFVSTDYPGRPGLYDSLCAFAVCDHLKTERYIIADSLRDIRINGRCETFPLPNGSSVIIDYAHNRLSVSELFASVSPYVKGRIFTVFGCGGERSKERRTGMGDVISQYSDVAVITCDNPRGEKLRSISRDIKKGIRKGSRCRFRAIYDRKKAIWYCMKKASENDVILVIGKGHEDHMEIGKQKYRYSDRETVISLADRLRDN